MNGSITSYQIQSESGEVSCQGDVQLRSELCDGCRNGGQRAAGITHVGKAKALQGPSRHPGSAELRYSMRSQQPAG